ISSPEQRQIIISAYNAVSIGIPVPKIAGKLPRIAKLSILNRSENYFFLILKLSLQVVAPYHITPTISRSRSPFVHTVDKGTTLYIHIHGPSKIEVPFYIVLEV